MYVRPSILLYQRSDLTYDAYSHIEADRDLKMGEGDERSTTMNKLIAIDKSNGKCELPCERRCSLWEKMTTVPKAAKNIERKTTRQK